MVTAEWISGKCCVRHSLVSQDEWRDTVECMCVAYVWLCVCGRGGGTLKCAGIVFIIMNLWLLIKMEWNVVHVTRKSNTKWDLQFVSHRIVDNVLCVRARVTYRMTAAEILLKRISVLRVSVVCRSRCENSIYSYIFTGGHEWIRGKSNESGEWRCVCVMVINVEIIFIFTELTCSSSEYCCWDVDGDDDADDDRRCGWVWKLIAFSNRNIVVNIAIATPFPSHTHAPPNPHTRHSSASTFPQ